jgi:enterochelin esterase-like enzyme
MPNHRLLTLVHSYGNPIIENEKATLVWEGPHAPLVIDDIHGWGDNPQKMKRVSAGMSTFTFTVPGDAYLEYGYVDAQSGSRIEDPFSHNKIHNGIDAYNHFFYMPGSGPNPLTHKRRDIDHGVITKHKIATQDYAAGSERTVYLYQPPVKEEVPLVLVYDGSDYLRKGKLNIIVDNLISENRIRPIAMTFVQNGGQARGLEYSCSELTLGFITECILPLAHQELKLLPPNKETYGVIGASLGGLMALFTGVRMHSLFGKVLSQSGAFGTPEYEFSIVDLIRYAPKPDIQIWMDAGRLEFLLEGNRQMVSLLKENDYRVQYKEFSAGHNYTAWRNDISTGLEFLFGK